MALTITVVLFYPTISQWLNGPSPTDTKIDAFEYYADLADDQGKSYDAGGAHITYFVGWAIENNLSATALGFDDPRYASEPASMGADALNTLAAFRERGDKGIELLVGYSEWLTTSMLTQDGAEFALEYFRIYTQRYFQEMERRFGGQIQELSEERYRLSKQLLDTLYHDFLRQRHSSRSPVQQ